MCNSQTLRCFSFVITRCWNRNLILQQFLTVWMSLYSYRCKLIFKKERYLCLGRMQWNRFVHASSSCSSCSDVLQTGETFDVPQLLRSFFCFFTWIVFLSLMMCLFVGERNSKNRNLKSVWARLVGKEEGLLRTATEMTSETKSFDPLVFFYRLCANDPGFTCGWRSFLWEEGWAAACWEAWWEACGGAVAPGPWFSPPAA